MTTSLAHVEPMSVDEAKAWLTDSDQTRQPTVESYAAALTAVVNKPTASNLRGAMPPHEAARHLHQIHGERGHFTGEDFYAAIREVAATDEDYFDNAGNEMLDAGDVLGALDNSEDSRDVRLIELGIAIGRLAENNDLSLSRLIDYALDEEDASVADSEPMDRLIAYIRRA